ncbi:MAG TPA: glycosyltransferase family 39 protein [Terriglobales bacterium]
MDHQPEPDSLFPRWAVVALVLLILFFAAIRFRLRNVPLERDEGEYAYAGQLLLHGIPPYQLAYNMKLPGTYAAYAVVLALFGQTAGGIHLGLILVNAATALLLYWLAARMFGPLAGLVSLASYLLLSTSESVLGLAAHATHFVVLFAVAGLLLLLHAIETRRVWIFVAAGLLLGMAFLMKQPGIFFTLFGGLWLLLSLVRGTAAALPHKWRHLLAYSVGAIAPLALTCLALFLAGVFHNFWFWTVSYGREYATAVTLSDGLHELWNVLPAVVGPSLWVWLIAAEGASAAAWNATARRHAHFVLGFLLFSTLAVFPGLNFRQHYFILMLPAVSLLVGIAASSAMEALGARKSALRPVLLVLVFAAFVISLFVQRAVLFTGNPQALSRQIYRENPFTEAPVIADYLKTHSSPDARIAVLGSEPEIYFYANRKSATGYIYTYSLMEPQKYAAEMQQQAIREIEAARPAFVVFVNAPVSWGVRPNSEKMILTWARRFLQDQYEVEGSADILDEPQYYWGEDAKTHQPRSRFTIVVFRRKADSAAGTIR